MGRVLIFSGTKLKLLYIFEIKHSVGNDFFTQFLNKLIYCFQWVVFLIRITLKAAPSILNSARSVRRKALKEQR